METIEIVREMMHVSGLSVRKLGTALGKSPQYMKQTLYGGTIPSSKKLAAIADACGYDLLVRNRDDGTEIIIDPPDEK